MSKKENLFVSIFVANCQFFQILCQNIPYKAENWHLDRMNNTFQSTAFKISVDAPLKID